MNWYKAISTFFLTILISGSLWAQESGNIQINGTSGLEKEFSSLMNDLELRNDQKLVLGILMLKYTVNFDYQEFENASKSKQYAMARSTIKELDKDLKEVLDKQQFKVYKKHKKKIKKELLNSV